MKSEIKFQESTEDKIIKTAGTVAELAFDIRFAGASLFVLAKVADAIQSLSDAAKLAKEEAE